jgi:hypothetical protein
VSRKTALQGCPSSLTTLARPQYIYESIRAATEILVICVESLHPGGALPYLPSRFTLLFQYGAVFLLKVRHALEQRLDREPR